MKRGWNILRNILGINHFALHSTVRATRLGTSGTCSATVLKLLIAQSLNRNSLSLTKRLHSRELSESPHTNALYIFLNLLCLKVIHYTLVASRVS